MTWFLFACLTTPKNTPTSPSFVHPLHDISIPTVAQSQPYLPPKVSVHTTKEGSSVLVHHNPKLPLVNLSIVLPGGYLQDEASWGRADVVASMMLKSNVHHDMHEQSELLRAQGSRIDVQLYEQHTTIELITHKENISTTLALISDMIFSPLFSQEEWTSLIEYKSTEIEQSQEDTSNLLYSIQNMILYPQDHPLYRLAQGSSSSIKKLNRETSKTWHSERLNPQHVGFLASGDIDGQTLTALIEEQFQQWPQTSWEPQPISWDKGYNKGLFLIDIPDEQQSTLRVLIPGWNEHNHPKALLRNTLSIAMGGTFTSRLNSKLREEKGYTYGAYCSFYESPTDTVLRVSTSVRRDATAPALRDLLSTLSSAQDGFSQGEWAKSTNTMRNNIISQYESRRSTLAAMERKWRSHRAQDIDHKRLQNLYTFDAQPPNDEANLFDYSNGVVIVAGDVAKIKESLAPWSFTSIELNSILD